MWTPEIVLIVGAVFLLAGLVKGLVGLGLPTISLALLTASLGLKEAMALMLVPAFATNLWQALAGRDTVAVARRLGPMLALSCVGIWFAVGVLARSDAVLLSGLFGILLCIYCLFGLTTPQIPSPGPRERWLSPAFGLISGFSAGLTGSFVVPGALYLQALGMPRDMLIQAMGMTFTVASLALAISLGGHDLLPADLGALSIGALVPSFLGMALGQKVRRRLPEALFRRVFFVALLALGVYIAARAFL